MRESDVILGNSSSGLTEAPALHRATVNVGGRQDGRLKASSVIDCAGDAKSIAAAIRRALSPEFKAALPATASLYGVGDASSAIVARLKADLPSLRKPFFDIAHAY
jgi:UDP-N-acetylglucosamine 2-epimerase (non-hydrolysing)/GDP/UDP-N,N'-diacetylbacillosamine 2-epimerase (hydrolysing)